MSNREKWFRSRLKPPVVMPIAVPDAEPTYEELEEFIEVCVRLKSPKTDWLVNLARMMPGVRLMTNCRTVISLMARHDIDSVIPQGLLNSEHEALELLARRGVSSDTQAIAQALLHVQIRQQLIATLGESFKAAKRSKHGYVGG